MIKKSLFLLLTLLILVACRGGGPGDEERPTPIAAAPAAEGGGSADAGGGLGQDIALRLQVQQTDAFRAAYGALADAYMAANPGVTVKVESIDPATYDVTTGASLAAGAAGDVVQLPGAVVCAAHDYLAAVPEAVTTLADAQSRFDPTVLSGFTCDGTLYGLPQETGTPFGLVVAGSSAVQEVAWDFARFATLDPANAAAWNAATTTAPALVGQ